MSELGAQEVDGSVREREAIEVILAVRIHLGASHWRDAIRRAWMTGNYERDGLLKWRDKLQTIRNTFGPGWLNGLRLPR